MPTSGAPEFREALGLLLDAGVEFIVVGGVAAVVQGAPVVTFDCDVVHRRTEENVARTAGVLTALGGRGRLDVLGAIEHGLDYDALLPLSEKVPFRGRELRVLTLDTLIRLKGESSAPKDRLMLLQLLEVRARREPK